MIPNYTNPMASLNAYVPDWNAPSNWMANTNTGGLAKLGTAADVTSVTNPTAWQGFTGYTDKNGIKTDGWGGLALGGISALGGAFLGMKQYGLAKKQLAETKRQFDLNYGAQVKNMNTAMEDRQRTRVANNAALNESVDSYMAKNRIK